MPDKETAMKEIGSLIDQKIQAANNAGKEPITKEDMHTLLKETNNPCEIEKRENNIKAGYYLLGGLKAKNDPEWEIGYTEDQIRQEIEKYEKGE